MVRDAKGRELKVGDVVLIPAIVHDVFDGPKANLTIVTSHEQPKGQGPLIWTLYSSLVEKASR